MEILSDGWASTVSPEPHPARVQAIVEADSAAALSEDNFPIGVLTTPGAVDGQTWPTPEPVE